MSDESFLICGLVLADVLPIEGSIYGKCSECEAWIWVSPTGLTILAKEASKLLCIPCGDRQIREDPKAEIMPLNAEQVAEIKNEIAKRRE